MLRLARVIALKDMRQRIRDKSMFINALLVPLGLAFIFNLTLSGATGGGFSVDFAVLTDDAGNVSSGFNGLLTELADDGFASVREEGTEAAIDQLIDDDEITAGFIFPSGLSDALEQGRPAAFTVKTNPEREIGSQVAVSIARGFAAEVTAVQRSVVSAIAAGAPATGSEEVAELVSLAQQTPTPITIYELEAASGGIDFTTFYAVGIAVFFVFFSVQYGILGILQEREAGTMTRLLAAPLRPGAIILGKLAASFVVGLGSMIVLWLATTFIMGAKWGNPVGVVVLIVAGVLAAMGVAAFAATIARTAEQAAGLASILAVVLGILGGTFFPVSQASGFLAKASLLTPHRWLIDGFRDLSAGRSLTEIVVPVAAVLAFALVTGGIGLARANRLIGDR